MAPIDVVAVAAIEKECAVSPWPSDLFMGEFSLPAESRRWLVAQVQEVIVGFAGAMVAVDEATLLNVGIAPRWQRRGVAHQLVLQLLDDVVSLSVRKVFLEVRVSNSKARGLYVKLGFEDVAVRKKYYSDGEDAVVMGLSV